MRDDFEEPWRFRLLFRVTRRDVLGMALFCALMVGILLFGVFYLDAPWLQPD